MPINNLKEELIAYIQDTDDEALLSLMKEDFLFYGKVKTKDITDNLSEEQFKELKELSEEDETKDVITIEEFTQLTAQWRTKL